MTTTSARLLALLGLLQSRADWSGQELAQRLGVTDRTVRNDVARLRELGYPVHTTRGPGGRYRLGAGAVLPPLLLDDEEAVAIAVGLRATTGMKAFEESGGRALTKLEQVMPQRIRRRIEALRSATSAGPVNTDSNVEDPVVEPELLTEISAAIRDRRTLRCDYEQRTVEVEPYHLVVWQRRWYLVCRDVASGRWEPLRVDWIRLRTPGGRRFSPAPPPEDVTEFVVREVAGAGWAVHARIVVDAPPDEVAARINPAVGRVEPHDDGRSVLVTGGDTLETVAVWIGMLGLDFAVEEPPELVDHLRGLAERYARAVERSAGP
ncbi:Helix-turn-helix type 11 domain protein [Xylanimonas cellulosilytica DSM 15894]|uniref:Helix-turn-helix type 11 domain protein n=1 Tax=Xylanimonas cellulosilytica (strain DSM 15894 / JCM 12276 / CECT 5975 / KCTC 9989 / LMG 20990 / NBRC 107835 / XIL07) TaxID=446471 RepID=D1BRS2_XYLCX|nr:WYL domain-containing protein [Xylanimonas cellulosilytica]ACZ32338.1 Helix-turn-helix type 11 domain protein [Xylanimonas cellulosilytica DSM 15894]